MDFQGANPQAVIEAVLKKWNDLNQAKGDKLRLWQECELAVGNKFGETWGEIADGRSHRYIPAAFQAVEASVAQFLQGTVPNDRFFKAIGRTKSDQLAAPSLEAKNRWDFYRLNWRSTYANALKVATILGNVPWTVVWRTERSVVPDDEMYQAKLAMQAIGMTVETNDVANLGYPTKLKTTFEGPQLVYGHPNNYVQDRSPDDPRYAFRVYRSQQSANYLKAKWTGLVDEKGKPIYAGLEDVSDGKYGDLEVGDSLQREVDRALGFTRFPDDKTELLTFCGDIDVPGEGYFHNVFGVIANRSTLLRFCSNPFAHGLPPWQLFSLIPNANDPFGYGTGVLEPSLGLFDFVNVRTNQVADANALAINPPIAAVFDGVTTRQNLVWGPGELLPVRNPGNIMPMQVPKDALNLGLQEINFYLNQISMTTGSQGAISGQGDAMSATQASGIQAQGNAVLTERFRHIKNNFLVPILRMHTSLNQQLMDPNNPILVRLEVDEDGTAIDNTTGEPMQPGMHWAEVSSSEIQGEFDFELIAGDEIAQSQQEVRDKISTYQMISQDPGMQPYLDHPAFLKSLLSTAGWKDAYKFIKSAAQVQSEQLQQQQAQQLAGPGMGNPEQPGGPPAPGTAPGNPGIPSVPGDAGGGGSPARTPYPEQLAGPAGPR